MLFETLFFIGLIGFVALVAMGAMHGHGHHASGHDSHVDLGHGHHDAGSIGHGHHDVGGAHGHHSAAGTHGHHDAQGVEKVSAFRLPFFLSPLNVFSFCLGMGATGLIVRKYFDLVTVFCLSAVGGLIFTMLLIKPIFALFMKFGSEPSLGLEGTVAQSVEAVSTFDGQGRGLIRIALDGEIVQLLARLEKSEIESGIRVQKGETVIITQIDAEKGTCTVTKELNG